MKKIMSNFFIVVCLFLIISFVIVPLFDKSSKWYVVTSNSMSPTLKTGDVIYIKKVNVSSIKKGDIICFKYEEKIITHRCIDIIKEKNETYFKTKGDANENEDSFLISTNDLIGKVYSMKILGYSFYIKIPLVGYLAYFAHKKIGFLLLILIPGILLIGLEVKNMFRRDDPNVKRKR